MVVVDASVVVAALMGGDDVGAWAESLLASEPLSAPHLMPGEASNILRRAEIAGRISADAASLAHADLLELRVELFPYRPFARRVWELRSNVTCYDGWYVALAEFLGAPVATLDVRLTKAAGPGCRFQTPPGNSGGIPPMGPCGESYGKVTYSRVGNEHAPVITPGTG